MLIRKGQAPVNACECLCLLLTYLPIKVWGKTSSLLEGVIAHRNSFPGYRWCGRNQKSQTAQADFSLNWCSNTNTFFFPYHNLMFLNLVPFLHIQRIKWGKALEWCDCSISRICHLNVKFFFWLLIFQTAKNNQETQIICLYCLNNQSDFHKCAFCSQIQFQVISRGARTLSQLHLILKSIKKIRNRMKRDRERVWSD